MKCASLMLICASLNAAVYFEPNRGQAPGSAPFVTRAGRASVALHSNGLVDRGRMLLTFEGARTAPASGEQLLSGVTHYARGNDPARWLWDVPHYARVRFAGVYPGIDIVYRGAGGQVEFDFELAAGADVSRIRMRPADQARIAETGALELAGMTLAPPAAWQIVAGRRVPVDVAFASLPHGRIGLRAGRYDRNLPLTIDPIVEFATYLGGSDDEADTQVLGGSDGAVYVAGSTVSADFPAALPDTDLLNRPVTLVEPDVYVTRLKADASAMDWSIFIGGAAADTAVALRADPLGNIYVVGRTSSANLPVTAGAWRTTIAQTLLDTFIAKLDPLTGRIKACTYLGFPVRSDSNPLVSVDAAGGVYIVADVGGATTAVATPGAYQTKPGFTYVTRLNSGLTGQVYGTFFDLGGLNAIDVDAGGNLWLGGAWQSPYFSATFPAINPIAGISQSGGAMVVRLNATGTALTFASLLGSAIFDLKVAPSGEVWVAGASGTAMPQVNPVAIDPLPANYPPTPDPSWPSPFLARLSPSGSTLLQSTFFYGPEFTPPGGTETSHNKHLLLGPTGSLCITNLPMRLTQSAGGLIAATDSFTPSGGTLYCLDDAAKKFIVKTGIPQALSYTSVAAAADGTVLYGGTALKGFATTAGAVQPNFAGGVSRDRFNIFPSFGSDALVLRVSPKNPAPAIAGVTPDALLLDAGTTGTLALQVSGSGFAYAMDTTVNGTPVTSTMMSATQARILAPYDELRAGTNTITLGLPAPGGGASQVTFNGINVTPSQISVLPSSVTQGAGETKIVISGGNLTAQSTLLWNGQPRDARFVLDRARLGHFELLLEPLELAQPQVAQITFTNPPPGGGVSPVAVFTVQPSSGGVPRLNVPGVVVIGAPAISGGRVAFTGSNFVAGMRAFWDGADVPVLVTSATAISVSPPAADLLHVGQHSLYVSLNGLISATVPVIVVSSLAIGPAVADVAGQRLYMIGGSISNFPQALDLLILDMRQGDLITTIPGGGSGVGFLALSDDGQYLYLGVNDLSGTVATSAVRRFNTTTRSIDLSWSLPPYINIWAIAAVPGSPETVIVGTTDRAITIYDRDQPRARTFQNLIQSTTTIPFVTANRLFLTATPQCWSWVDFDPTGVISSQQCGPEPPEVKHDSGVVYLTDGTHNYPVATPLVPVSQFILPPILAMDLSSRRVAQLSNNGSSRTLTLYNMDTQQQQTLFTFGSAQSSSGLWFNQSGNLLVQSFPYLTFVR